jgi:tetratricopeptide (TPR) repeat protein
MIARLKAIREQLEGARKDQELLDRLEKARDLGAAAGADGNEKAMAEWLYEEAFREYGLDPERTGPEETAKRIRGSARRAELVEGLDDWAALAPPQKRAPLTAAAAAADPDTWRQRLRAATARQDWAAIRWLADDEEVRGLSPSAVVRLARALKAAGAPARAAALLREGQWRHPADFGLSFELANELLTDRPAQPDEAARYYEAVLAWRPGSGAAHYGLGIALREQGRLKEARTQFAEALRLNPGFAPARRAETETLQRQLKADAAEAEFREAKRLTPPP